MTLHTATLLIDGDHLRVDLTCHAAPDASCRQDTLCDCETYSLERDDDGWFHTVWRDPDDLPPGEDEEVQHRMRPGAKECNYIFWITEAGGYLEEYYEGPETTLDNTPILFRWDGDGYTWSPA